MVRYTFTARDFHSLHSAAFARRFSLNYPINGYCPHFFPDPSYLPSMLVAIQEADVVVGSRYVDGISIVNWPLNRLIVSKLGTAYARIVTGLPVTDATSGFKCYRADVLRTLDLRRIRSNGYVFQVETTFRAWRRGFAIRDFPIIFYERKRGESKLHLDIALEACWVVFRLGLERLYIRKNGRVTA